MIADRDMNSSVLPEHVREAQEKTDSKLSDEDVSMLPEDEKYVLLAERVVSLALSKAGEIQRYFMKVIGFEEFAGYLNDTDEGKRFFTARDKIKQLLGS